MSAIPFLIISSYGFVLTGGLIILRLSSLSLKLVTVVANLLIAATLSVLILFAFCCSSRISFSTISSVSFSCSSIFYNCFHSVYFNDAKMFQRFGFLRFFTLRFFNNPGMNCSDIFSGLIRLSINSVICF